MPSTVPALRSTSAREGLAMIRLISPAFGFFSPAVEDPSLQRGLFSAWGWLPDAPWKNTPTSPVCWL
eukprot:8098614-Alexandrium_andersonii.AAC.1